MILCSLDLEATRLKELEAIGCQLALRSSSNLHLEDNFGVIQVASLHFIFRQTTNHIDIRCRHL